MNGSSAETGKMKNKVSFEFMIGVFLLAGLLILLYFTAVVNGKDFLFGKVSHTLKIKFPTVDTLTKNDKVFYRGMQIGNVAGFMLDEQNTNVIVTVKVDRQLVFHEDYQAQIRNASFFGGKYINVDTGTTSKPIVKEGTRLEGIPPVDIVTQASELISSLKQDEETFSKEILKGETIQNIKTVIQSAKEISESIKEGKGTMGKLINDPSLYDDAKQLVDKISSTSTEIRNLTGEVKSIVDDVRDGKGTFGKLIKDDSIHDDLKSSLEDLKSITSSISKGDGSLGKIMNDNGKLYENLNQALDTMNKVSLKLSEGQGTIGKLLNDDALYNDTKEAVLQLRGAIEDFREQAPIATFGSLLLGAL